MAYILSASSRISHRMGKQPTVKRILRSLKKASTRDSRDQTSRSLVIALEVAEALQKFHPGKPQSVITNDNTLVETFFVSRHRPDVNVELDIVYPLSEGGGIGFVTKQYASAFTDAEVKGQLAAVLVPKAVVGDRVRAKLCIHHPKHVEADLVSVLEPASGRIPPVCGKFAVCTGCQFQMIPYTQQLLLKQEFIRRAFRFHNPLFPQDADFGRVVGSPLQYGYRNKLTPHYYVKKTENDFDSVPIGLLGLTNKVVDIDHCPIATDSINRMIPQFKAEERKRMTPGNHTMLIRELVTKNDDETFTLEAKVGANIEITQPVGENMFTFNLMLFFQNNSFIIPKLMDFIKELLKGRKFEYIVDTYCGLGLFAISLARHVEAKKIVGIEIDPKLIEYARKNAATNGLLDKVNFYSGDASNIFEREEFKELELTGENTVVVIDPPRKGLNEGFLKQLYQFGPQAVVYVSCNVQTQARDLATLAKFGDAYQVQQVVGFDMFPHTKHIESVTILSRRNQ